MLFTNEQFTVKNVTVFSGTNAKTGTAYEFANVYLTQECPINPRRTIDFKICINGGKAKPSWLVRSERSCDASFTTLSTSTSAKEFSREWRS